MSAAAPRYTPPWSSGAFHTRVLIIPDQPSAFETLVRSVGLEKRPDLWRHNDKLRAFARRYYKVRYVPEWFLDEVGLGDVEVEL